ncbi:UNVERIFIED_CONTAM: hypothetical protein H355_009338 [Colinus virginianus]|nr:hypothetical protein H355_009338 [Colinus virginianus]
MAVQVWVQETQRHPQLVASPSSPAAGLLFLTEQKEKQKRRTVAQLARSRRLRCCIEPQTRALVQAQSSWFRTLPGTQTASQCRAATSLFLLQELFSMLLFLLLLVNASQTLRQTAKKLQVSRGRLDARMFLSRFSPPVLWCPQRDRKSLRFLLRCCRQQTTASSLSDGHQREWPTTGKIPHRNRKLVDTPLVAVTYAARSSDMRSRRRKETCRHAVPRRRIREIRETLEDALDVHPGNGPEKEKTQSSTIQLRTRMVFEETRHFDSGARDYISQAPGSIRDHRAKSRQPPKEMYIWRLPAALAVYQWRWPFTYCQCNFMKKHMCVALRGSTTGKLAYSFLRADTRGVEKRHVKVKAHELRGKTQGELVKQLEDLKKELSQLRVAQLSGGAASKVSKIIQIRKGIARVLTVYKEKQIKEARKAFKGKKFTPLDLREKKTRAMRRELTFSQKRKVTVRCACHHYFMRACVERFTIGGPERFTIGPLFRGLSRCDRYHLSRLPGTTYQRMRRLSVSPSGDGLVVLGKKRRAVGCEERRRRERGARAEGQRSSRRKQEEETQKASNEAWMHAAREQGSKKPSESVCSYYRLLGNCK